MEKVGIGMDIVPFPVGPPRGIIDCIDTGAAGLSQSSEGSRIPA
jgi:hypothetical protein